jgi:hypothetical protein
VNVSFKCDRASQKEGDHAASRNADVLIGRDAVREADATPRFHFTLEQRLLRFRVNSRTEFCVELRCLRRPR